MTTLEDGTHIVDYWASDYSPFYQLHVGKDYDFIKIVKKFNFPPAYGGAIEEPVRDALNPLVKEGWENSFDCASLQGRGKEYLRNLGYKIPD